MYHVKARVTDAPASSVTRSVNVNVPNCCGRPDTYVNPGAKFDDKASPGVCTVTPTGSNPSSSDHEYGGVPPCAVSWIAVRLPIVGYPNCVFSDGVFEVVSGCGVL